MGAGRRVLDHRVGDGCGVDRRGSSRNIVHAALFLVVVLAGAAALYILLVAEFVAWVQVLIYIGAVVILFLFGIMLTRAPMGGEPGQLDNDQRWGAAVVALFVLGVLVALLVDAFGGNEHPLHGRARGAGQDGHRRRQPVPRLPGAVRGGLHAAAGRARGRGRAGAEGLMDLNYFLILSAFLFCVGVYGVLARRNGVLVLMSVELMLNAVSINLIAFSAFQHNVSGQIFALFVITIAAAEVGVGLAIVLLIYRNLKSPDLDKIDELKG